MGDGDDVHAIHTLLYRYAELLDSGEFAGVAALLADADIIVGGKVVGRGERFVEQMLTTRVIVHDDGTPRTRHLITNPIVEFDDTDQARGRSCYTVLQPGATGIDIVVTGRHHDTFRRVDGRWRFASRDYTFMDFTGDTANHLR